MGGEAQLSCSSIASEVKLRYIQPLSKLVIFCRTSSTGEYESKESYRPSRFPRIAEGNGATMCHRHANDAAPRPGFSPRRSSSSSSPPAD